MLPPTTRPRRLRFGSFEVDPESRELYLDGQRVKLQAQPFHVLSMLLERDGALVTREELKHALWPRDTFVDFDQGLNKAIKKLREALRDSAEHPRLLETLPKRGYRFLAQVETVAPRSPSPDATSEEQGCAQLVPQNVVSRANAESPQRVSVPRCGEPRRGIKFSVLVSFMFVTLAAVLIALNVGGTRDRLVGTVGMLHGSATPAIDSVAVLPLENFSRDPAQQYFADEMTEVLITTLGKIHALRVISRTSVMRYKGTRKSLPEIGRELNADAIVEGTVSRSGNRVRITANLVYAPTDRHLWAESYESNLGDVLALQAEVARAIANQIQIELTPWENVRLTRRNPTDPNVQELYLKGRYYLSKRTEEGFQAAVQCFSQAIEKDDQYAPAYAGMADSYTLLARYGFRAPRDAYPKAKAAATKAVELDDMLGEAHASLAWTAFIFDWRWAVAEKEFVRALKLDPSYARGHHWHGLYLAAMGRIGEATTELKLARELDPLSLSINSSQGEIAYLLRDYDRAIERFHESLALDPNFAEAYADLAEAYEQKGMFDQALQEWHQAIRVSGRNRFQADLAHAFALSGRQRLARRILAEITAPLDRRLFPAVEVAATYAALGERNQALKWLERGYQERQGDMVFLRVNPDFDRLGSDPRFKELLRRMNFPP
jgi:TolB-like protein/DNA-binding winged helix-turn-helix (wHTH) protein/Flp pilus assembly protein TadD